MLDGATALGTVAINQELAPNDFTDAGAAWEDLGTFSLGGAVRTRVTSRVGLIEPLVAVQVAVSVTVLFVACLLLLSFDKLLSVDLGFDKDTAFYNPGTFSPVRHNETVLEATYQYEVAPWWQVQPDIQYVFNPGGGIVNPYEPTQSVKNELVFGVRTNITF